MKDNLERWERHDREQEEWLQKRPVCVECGEHIQEEHLYEIDGDLVCEDCLKDYMKKNYQQRTERYAS